MRKRIIFRLLELTLLALIIGAPHPSLEVVGQPTQSGTFFDSGQSLGNATSLALALADLDGDSDLDAWVANSSSASSSEIWLNNGAGQFTTSGQAFAAADSQEVILADVDGMSGVDAILANLDGMNRVWMNDGTGQFTAGQAFDSSLSQGAAAGDLDGDSIADVFFANQGGNTVWLNASGVFSNTGQSLGAANSFAVALADLDGDLDLDAFVANGGGSGQPDKVWINQGGMQGGTPGIFMDGGQDLGSAWTYDVALGDLDGDGDPDAFTAQWYPHGNKVWINQGGSQGGTAGVFLDSGQMLGSVASLGVVLADVDGDADLDAFVASNYPAGCQVWLNNGSGGFTDSGQVLGADTTHNDAALTDLDGDGDPDAFTASFGPNRVFRNDPAGLPTATFSVARQINPHGEEVYYQALSGDAILPVMLSHTVTETVEVHARIASTSTIVTSTLSFAPGAQLKYLNLVDPDPNPNETYTLTLSLTPQDIPPTPADQTDRLLFVFIDGDQGMQNCILCYIEWLGQFVGIDPIFDQLHHMTLEDQRASPLWPYYTALFDFHSPEMTRIVAANPPLLWNGLNTIDAWTPAVQALSDGNGASFMITQPMVAGVETLLDGIQAKASPALQAAIQLEQDALDLPSFAGMNVNIAWDEIQQRRQASLLYLVVVIK